MSISGITIDAHPIHTIEVASKLMHYTPMSTLVGSSSEALRRLGLMKPGCRKYQPCFRLVSSLQEMSAEKQVQKKKHIFFIVERGTGKKPSFQSYKSPLDTHLITS